MKVGDLVKYNSLGRVVSGIIVRFDEEDDHIILDFRTKAESGIWKDRVEVVSESR